MVGGVRVVSAVDREEYGDEICEWKRRLLGIER